MEQSPQPRLIFFDRFIFFWKVHSLLRRITLGLLLWLAAAFLLMFIPGWHYPRAIVFDETYYIPMAQKYLNGVFYQEEHPPLARLFITLGQKLTHPDSPSNEVLYVEKVKDGWPKNVDISGYRLFPVIFGTFLSPLVYWILLIILDKDGMAFLGGLLVLFDNALLTQSRFALPESFLLTFVLTTILLFSLLWKNREQVSGKTYIIWVLWGFSFASAFGVKLTALFLFVLIPLYLIVLIRKTSFRIAMRFVVIFGVAFSFLTIAIWQIHFSLIPNLNPDNTYNISDVHLQILEGALSVSPVERFMVQMSDAISYTFDTHGRVPSLRLGAIDEIGSPWYFWPFGGKAISYRWETPEGSVFRNIYMLGNPMSWLASLFGVIVGTAIAITNFLFRYYTSPRSQWVYLLTGLYWTYMAGIMTIDRVMYLYHYLPPLLIGIVLSVVIFVDIPTLSRFWRRAMVALVLIGLIAGFVTYMPFTYYLPLTREQIIQRNVWPAWQLYIGGTPIEPPP